MENLTGKHVANPVNVYATKSAQKGTPGICIEFRLKEVNQSLTWTGWLTPETKERTIETLLLCGFRGRKLEDVCKGREVIDSSLELSVVVEVEEYTNQNGEIKRYNKIKWVNAGSYAKNKVEGGELVRLFAGLNLDGDLIRIRNKIQIPETTFNETGSNFTSDDIPF